MAQFDIREAYRQIFGYKGLPFPAAPGLPFNTNVQRTLNRVGSALFGRGMLNNSYFMRVALGGTFRNPEYLPNEPMIELGFSKTMIRTPIVQSTGTNARRGTVKELYGMDDYSIRIRGLIINEEDSDEYPDEAILAIRNLIEKRQSVYLGSKLTDIFGINRLAIDGGEFPYDSGYPGIQRYEIRGYSDDNVELEINEGL